jgi:hypothetical protein
MDRCISIIDLSPCCAGWDAAPRLLLAGHLRLRVRPLFPRFSVEPGNWSSRGIAPRPRNALQEGNGLTQRRKKRTYSLPQPAALRAAPFAEFFPDFREFGARTYVGYMHTHGREIENVTVFRASSAQRRPPPRALAGALETAADYVAPRSQSPCTTRQNLTTIHASASPEMPTHSSRPARRNPRKKRIMSPKMSFRDIIRRDRISRGKTRGAIGAARGPGRPATNYVAKNVISRQNATRQNSPRQNSSRSAMWRRETPSSRWGLFPS